MGNSGRPKKCDPKVDLLWQNIRHDDFQSAKQILKEFGINVTDGEGRTALNNSASENKIEFAKWLIENGAEINHIDREGYSSLHFCAQNKFTAFAKLLLDNGADPNITDKHGNSPLWTAVFNSKEDKSLVKLLLQNGANPDLINNHGKSPRLMFKTFYNIDIVELMA